MVDSFETHVVIEHGLVLVLLWVLWGFFLGVWEGYIYLRMERFERCDLKKLRVGLSFWFIHLLTWNPALYLLEGRAGGQRSLFASSPSPVPTSLFTPFPSSIPTS